MSIFAITGGAGFIGSHLATRLGQAGHEVRVLDLLKEAGAKARAAQLADIPQVALVQGDICEPDTCRAFCAGADFVLHHAAEASVASSIQDPGACVRLNIGGTVNMLEAARAAGTVQRFVFASSCAVYGDTPALSKQEADVTDPLSPYASSKLAGEFFCRNFFHLHGLQTVALRYFNVYGPGQDPEGAYAAVIPRFLTAMSRNEPLTLYGDGKQSRDFVYVDDIVEANLRAVSTAQGAGGRVFNIGSGQPVSLNQLREKLEAIVGHPIRADRQPPRAGEIKHSCADPAVAAELLEFRASVSLESGLARSLQYYQQQA